MFNKKLINILAIIFLILATLEISAVLSNNFFFEKVSKQEAQKRSLPTNAANAIKHAYAASLLYSTFRQFFLSENSAKNLTIYFGKLNEIAEVIFKLNQDSTLEMIKDLSNNVLGICAAQALEKNPNSNRLNFIGSLAEKKKLFLNREDVFLDEIDRKKARETFSYSAATKWFEANKNRISCNFEDVAI